MCGINGIFAYHYASSQPAESELLATRDAMQARGPDGAGMWWSENRRCGLGHRRLAILDLSDRAAQPMVSEEGDLTVVFNGEIYNYPALRRDLEVGGAYFRTTSDTEVLLHLYARHGADMVHELRGMFGFAIWDAKRGGLFLARDPYGIKPLYSANDGWTFRFASQVKALLAGGLVSRDPEPAGIVGFHLFGSVPEPFTLYREIRSLPAGHTQWVDAAGPREPKPFANLAGLLAAGARNPAPASELNMRVRNAVLDSVGAHLLADVEVGAFLSAGVDSGALLGLMRDAGQRKIRAITLAFDEFDGTEEDEAPLAARIAARYGAQHIVRRVSESEFRDDLPAILEAMDQPSIDGVNTWFIAKAAKEAGLKVAISGLGGDEFLAGYPSFVDVPRWYRRLGPLALVPGLGRLTRSLIKTVAPAQARARPKMLGVLEYAGTWPGAYLLRRGLFLPYELGQIMDPDLAREGLRRLKPLRRLATSIAPDPGSDTGRVCALESSHYLRNQLLRDADWAGMAHSIEIRVPLVDITLLRSLAPVIGGLVPGAGKAALAHAPTVPLPAEIMRRGKTGFGVPTAAWMNAIAGAAGLTVSNLPETKGLASRQWSRVAFAGRPIEPRELRAA
ncbi:MAG TPA: asparagine synthase (glutamine-hydrolyzing) [Methyloceanibacter sp.]|nr:asparagine synthase (glutamine-hydrolyzing) [Methyloceanibacter sp.]